MIKLRQLLLLAGIPLIVAAPAYAHPKGQRPVIAVHRTSTGFDVSWIVAADDMQSLGEHLKLGPVKPTAFATFEAYRTYVSSRLTIASEEPCEASMLGVSEVATGFSTALFYECGATPEIARISSSLLLDISREYVHIFNVETPTGTKRGTLVAGDPTASISFDPGATEQPQPSEEPDGQGKLEGLIRGEGGVPLFVGIGIALLLGAVHGLTPGHGKTLTAAYITGVQGTMRHAFLLSGVVAVAHGVSTLALAGIAAGVDKLAPERITPWLEGAAALLAAVVGVMMLRGSRLLQHSHDHGDDHDHPHPQARSMPLGQLVAIGVVGGLIPGPEAFAVGFLAVALDQIFLGLVLILAFSLGLALVVLGVASLAVFAGERIGRGERTERMARVIGGIVFLAVAAFLAASALTG